LADVALNKSKAPLAAKVSNVLSIAGGEVVDANDGVAFAQQAIG
jgi:hypothetical protein